MCGRFTLIHTAEELARIFHIRHIGLAYPLSYNIAPSQETAVVLGSEGESVLRTMNWGLIPSWAKDAKIGNRMINARSETASEKPAFRIPFRRRRCVVPASGFYEWKKTADGKVPHYITSATGEVLPFAGLWDRWNKDRDTVVETFTILTTAANQTLAPIHDRMPVILNGRRWEEWLRTPESDLAKLQSLCAPSPSAGGPLTVHPVSRRVNSPANNEPSLIRPVPGTADGGEPAAETPSLF